jgi:hypothetical protein
MVENRNFPTNFSKPQISNLDKSCKEVYIKHGKVDLYMKCVKWAALLCINMVEDKRKNYAMKINLIEFQQNLWKCLLNTRKSMFMIILRHIDPLLGTTAE